MKTKPRLPPKLNPPRRGIAVRKLVWGLALLLIPVAVGVAALTVPMPFGKKAADDLLRDTVKRGSLEILVTEYGSLDSANNITLYSEVEGATTIIKIVEEGTKVEKGQVLVELDSSKQRDLEVTQKITFEKASADLKQAEENLKIQQTQNESDLAAAELKYKLAQLDNNQLMKGDRQKQVAEYEGTIALAHEDVTRAEETLDFVKRNNKKGYVNQNDVEAARIALEQKKYALKVAAGNLDLYIKFTFERLKAEKNANEKEFLREIERTKLKASAALTQVEATLKASRLTKDAEQAKLKKLHDQILACIIKAPQAGEVVYANQQSQNRRGASDTGIMEGAIVRERQAIINLPDLTQARVSTKIHESRIGWVSTGLPVVVRVDALPGEVFYGEVDNISTVPISGNWRTPDLKEYTAIISIKDPNVERIRKLKPGLTAQVEIHVDSVENALLVPVQAVAEWNGKHYVFAINNGVPEKREVEIGKTNDVQIQLLEPKSQIKEGNEVVLNPRPFLPKEHEAPADRSRGLLKKPGEKDKGKSSPDEKKKTPDSPGNASPGNQVASAGSPGQNVPAGTPGAAGDRPRREGGGERGPNGPAAAGGGGQGGSQGGGRGGGTPQERFARFDKNSDGKITQDELPEPMQAAFARIDTNGDGFLDLEEVSKMPRGNRGGGAGPADGPGGAGRGMGQGGGGEGMGRGQGGGGGEGGGGEGMGRGQGGGGGEGGGRRRNRDDAGAG